MSAIAMIDDLRRAGIHLSSNGDRLHIEAPKGTLTPELRLVLSERKPELLAALQGDSIAPLRAQLERLATAEGIDPLLVHSATDAEIDGCRALPDSALRSYVISLRDVDMRQRGEVPQDETASALCRHCGPVWVHPAIAAVAPVVNGWPRLLGCAWCHVKGYIPRPQVTCGDCSHFVRDEINPDGGMGSCGAACDNGAAPTYPHAIKQCTQFQPKDAA